MKWQKLDAGSRLAEIALVSPEFARIVAVIIAGAGGFFTAYCVYHIKDEQLGWGLLFFAVAVWNFYCLWRIAKALYQKHKG